MNDKKILAYPSEPSDLPSNDKERHEILVDCFGEFLFWLRNWALESSRELINSEAIREKIGNVRRKHYEGASQLNAEDRQAAMLLVEETLNSFLERLIWFLGNEGSDALFGTHHAYRFRVELEIVDIDTGNIVLEETINRGGKFFGSNWGRWLNRYASK